VTSAAGTASFEDLDRETLRGLTIHWPEAYGRRGAQVWLEPILSGIRAHRTQVELAPIPQPETTAALVEVDAGKGRRRVVIDWGDRPELAGVEGEPALVTFKLQHALEGYPQPNVVPGGYVTGGRRAYPLLRLLRALRGRPRFSYDVYGRFGLRHGAELRKRAFELLSAREDLRYEGSLFRYEGGPEKVPYLRYLREISRAKVCVDLPGKGDLCFRLVDGLALGACVVRPPLLVRLPAPLVAGAHFVECAPDVSDLGDVCARLVADADERERIARGARHYFDRYLHRRRLAAYYLHEICRRLGQDTR
jgi:hypothetical protein